MIDYRLSYDYGLNHSYLKKKLSWRFSIGSSYVYGRQLGPPSFPRRPDCSCEIPSFHTSSPIKPYLIKSWYKPTLDSIFFFSQSYGYNCSSRQFGLAMAVRATMTRFPADPRELECGLPWGITLMPFAAKEENGNPPVYGSGGELLPRCENCWGYYNTYCDQDQWSWSCVLCGTLNGLSAQSIARYSLPDSCPENTSSFVDLEIPRNYCIIPFASLSLSSFYVI